MALTGLISAAAGLRLIADIFIDETYRLVRLNLNTAHRLYAQSLREVETTARFTADRNIFKEALARGILPLHEKELLRIRAAEGLDILALLGPDGRRHSPPGTGPARIEDPVLRAMLQTGVVSSTLLLPPGELERFTPGLSERAAITLIDTPRAKETSLRGIGSGLVLTAAAPVRDGKGRLLGYVLGGRLLSRDTRMVDDIMRILYHGLRYKGRDVGVVTLFQDDVRIATTVQAAGGERAVGTRGSAQVLGRTGSQEEPVIDRAFVLGDWYITSHETIRDLQGKPLGSLFVGVLESRYTGVRTQVLLVFLVIVAGGMAAALLVGYWLSGRIAEPLKTLTEAARRLAAGDLGARARLDTKDEFGSLGAAFDRMAQSIQGNARRARQDSDRRIADSERLAMVGQLAAGIAHEVNNPLGGILVYSHLLLDDTPKDDPRRANLEKIAQETSRCRDIVRSLLDFARQGELNVEDADLHALIGQALDLAGTHKTFRNVRVVQRFADGIPALRLDRGKLQQVLLNVLFNAAESMEGRPGTLTVTTRLTPRPQRVEIRIRDTGCGMPPEVLDKVFEPFFTTKEVGKGVGLGLAVSSGIVQRHGGSMEIRSRAGHGTVVRILIPAGGAA